ncbi:MAG: hypothetical protein ACK53Y_06290, partial [bacterium]
MDSEVFVHTHSPPHVAKVVGLPSYERPNIYTVQFADGSLLEYSDCDNILEANQIVLLLQIQPYYLPGFKMVLILHSSCPLCRN